MSIIFSCQWIIDVKKMLTTSCAVNFFFPCYCLNVFIVHACMLFFPPNQLIWSCLFPFFSKSLPRVMQWRTNWGRRTRSSRLRYRLVIRIKWSSKVSESDFFDIYFYIKLKNCIYTIWYRYLISYYVQEKVYTVDILGLLEMEEKKHYFLLSHWNWKFSMFTKITLIKPSY